MLDIDRFKLSPTHTNERTQEVVSKQCVSECSSKPSEKIPLPRHKKGQTFLKGPVPMDWIVQASKCGNRAEAITILLWHLAGMQHPMKLTPTALAKLSVNPKTAKRTLRKMADAGLVEVEFHRGRSPRVKILPAAAVTVDEELT